MGVTQPFTAALTPPDILLAAYSFTRLLGAHPNTNWGKLELDVAFWVADLVISGDLPAEPLSLPPDLVHDS